MNISHQTTFTVYITQCSPPDTSTGGEVFLQPLLVVTLLAAELAHTGLDSQAGTQTPHLVVPYLLTGLQHKI